MSGTGRSVVGKEAVRLSVSIRHGGFGGNRSWQSLAAEGQTEVAIAYAGTSRKTNL